MRILKTLLVYAAFVVALCLPAPARAQNFLCFAVNGTPSCPRILFGSTLVSEESSGVLQLGEDAAGVTNQMFKGPDRITSDGVGGNLILAGGRNRGASVGGSVGIQTSPAAGIGVTGTLVDRVEVNSVGTTLHYLDDVGVTSFPALTLWNRSAAALGAQQYSPGFSQIGYGWQTNTSTSMPVETRWELRPVQGVAAPTASYAAMYRINNGAWADFLTWTQTGNTVTVGNIAAGDAVRAPAIGRHVFDTRGLIRSPADGQFNFLIAAETAGIGVDFATDALLKVRTRAQTGDAGISALTATLSGPAAALGSGASSSDLGSVRRLVSKYSVTSAVCVEPFQAAATTADCVIATLPVKTRLVAIYADTTTGWTCSGTCTGTKTMGVGKSAGGVEYLKTGLDVAATGQWGLADADMGSEMTRAAAIQGSALVNWAATIPVTVRFTSGTGNWGSGSATYVNAGTTVFYLVTESLP